MIHLEPYDIRERKQNIEPCLSSLRDEEVNLTGVHIDGEAFNNTLICPHFPRFYPFTDAEILSLLDAEN